MLEVDGPAQCLPHCARRTPHPTRLVKHAHAPTHPRGPAMSPTTVGSDASAAAESRYASRVRRASTSTAVWANSCAPIVGPTTPTGSDSEAHAEEASTTHSPSPLHRHTECSSSPSPCQPLFLVVASPAPLQRPLPPSRRGSEGRAARPAPAADPAHRFAPPGRWKKRRRRGIGAHCLGKSSTGAASVGFGARWGTPLEPLPPTATARSLRQCAQQ